MLFSIIVLLCRGVRSFASTPGARNVDPRQISHEGPLRLRRQHRPKSRDGSRAGDVSPERRLPGCHGRECWYSQGSHQQAGSGREVCNSGGQASRSRHLGSSYSLCRSSGSEPVPPRHRGGQYGRRDLVLGSWRGQVTNPQRHDPQPVALSLRRAIRRNNGADRGHDVPHHEALLLVSNRSRQTNSHKARSDSFRSGCFVHKE